MPKEMDQTFYEPPPIDEAGYGLVCFDHDCRLIPGNRFFRLTSFRLFCGHLFFDTDTVEDLLPDEVPPPRGIVSQQIVVQIHSLMTDNVKWRSMEDFLAKKAGQTKTQQWETALLSDFLSFWGITSVPDQNDAPYMSMLRNALIVAVKHLAGEMDLVTMEREFNAMRLNGLFSS